MIRTRALALSALLTLALSGAASASGAGGSAPKAWVSSVGVDAAGCGALTSPCRTFQYSHDNIVAPGGSIYVRDAGTFGAFNISHTISVINDGSGAAAINSVAGTPAITIAAGASDVIFIKGLTVNNTAGAKNTMGISILSAGSVSLDHVTVTGLDANGLNIVPTTTMNVTLSNSLIENNGSSGVWVYPSGSANVTLEATGLLINNNGHTYNGNGFYINGDGTSGTITVLFSDSTVNFNQQVGFGGAGARVTLVLTRCTGSGNGRGAEVFNGQSGVPTAYTYGDNRFKGNSPIDISGFATASGQ